MVVQYLSEPYPPLLGHVYGLVICEFWQPNRG